MIISKVIEVVSPKMPPDIEFIEDEIKKQGIEPLRWAIVETNNNRLLISCAGCIINNCKY